MARAPSRSPGKGTLVDTWTYDATFSVGEGDDIRKETKKVAVELRLIKEFSAESSAPPLATKSVKFTVLCKEIDLSVEGTDIEVLRTATWEKLDARFKIGWEDWLLVKVDRQAPYTGIGSGFVFSYDTVERGVAFDGSVLLREYVRYGDQRHRITGWPTEFKEKGGRTVACIPATAANREGLDEFARRIDEMRRQLAEFVKPDAILKTLADIGAHLAIAGEAAAAPRLGKPKPSGG